MNDSTNFHSILASAIDHDDSAICLSSHPYEGFRLYGVPITPSDLLWTARASTSLRDQLRQVRDEAAAALADVEPASAKTPEDELNAAAAVFEKHVKSGYLLELFVESRSLSWLGRRTK